MLLHEAEQKANQLPSLFVPNACQVGQEPEQQPKQDLGTRMESVKISALIKTQEESYASPHTAYPEEIKLGKWSAFLKSAVKGKGFNLTKNYCTELEFPPFAEFK